MKTSFESTTLGRPASRLRPLFHLLPPSWKCLNIFYHISGLGILYNCIAMRVIVFDISVQTKLSRAGSRRWSIYEIEIEGGEREKEKREREGERERERMIAYLYMYRHSLINCSDKISKISRLLGCRLLGQDDGPATTMARPPRWLGRVAGPRPTHLYYIAVSCSQPHTSEFCSLLGMWIAVDLILFTLPRNHIHAA